MALKKYDEEVVDKAIKNLPSRRNARQPFSHVSLALMGEKRPRDGNVAINQFNSLFEKQKEIGNEHLFLKDLSDKEIYESYSKDAEEELNQYLDNIINSKGKVKKTRKKNKKGKKTRRKNKKGKKTRRRRR